MGEPSPVVQSLVRLLGVETERSGYRVAVYQLFGQLLRVTARRMKFEMVYTHFCWPVY